jgi:hypothetical protein
MFISTKQLVNQYGLDEAIARFFVNREPPVNNLYWHEKLLYLRPSPGYLFIPIIVDLLYKLGLDKQDLLSEQFIHALEDIGHISALEEADKISRAVAINKCEELVKRNVANQQWLETVTDYFKGEKDNILTKMIMPFKSLHRGDFFLFSLSTIHFPVTYFNEIGEQWFALIGILLLLDDADDIEIDKTTGDENAFLESGLNTTNLERIGKVVEQGVDKIARVNPTLAAALARQHRAVAHMPHILKHLNLSE